MYLVSPVAWGRIYLLSPKGSWANMNLFSLVQSRVEVTDRSH